MGHKRPFLHGGPLLHSSCTPSSESQALVFGTTQTALQMTECPPEDWGQTGGGMGRHRLAEWCGHEPESWHPCPGRWGAAGLSQPHDFPFVGEGWNSCFSCSWCYIHERLFLDAQLEFGHGQSIATTWWMVESHVWLCPGFRSLVPVWQFTRVKSGISWGHVGWILGPVTKPVQKELNEIKLVISLCLTLFVPLFLVRWP